MEPLISSVQWKIFILLCLNVTITLCCKPIAQMDATADVKTDVKAQANVDVMENLANMVGIEKGAFDGFIKSGAFKGIEEGGVTGMQSGAISILKNMREVVGMQSGAVVGMESGAVDIDTNIITDINADFGGVMVGIIAISAMGGFIIMFSIAACLIKKIINKISQKRNQNKNNAQAEDGENSSSKKSTTKQKIIFGVIILTVVGCYVFLFLSMHMIAEVSNKNMKLKTQVKLNAYFIEFFSMNGQLEKLQNEIQGLQNKLKKMEQNGVSQGSVIQPTSFSAVIKAIGSNSKAIGVNKVAIGANKVDIGANSKAIVANKDALAKKCSFTYCSATHSTVLRYHKMGSFYGPSIGRK